LTITVGDQDVESLEVIRNKGKTAGITDVKQVHDQNHLFITMD